MKLNTYQKVALSTIGATLFLIFVGGLVRASGAGLGCPDWPKCFGSWIPPSSASQLPAQFDASLFNLLKMWTEYINRLVGVITGLLIIATFALSFRYRKFKPAVFYNSGAAFILVIVQGWLGGQVVTTGLNQWLITLHLLLAVIIVMTLIYAVFTASAENIDIRLSQKSKNWLIGSTLLLLVVTSVQLILGAQVRESVDMITSALQTSPQQAWAAHLPAIAKVHRTFAWIVLIVSGLVCYLSWKNVRSQLIKKVGTLIFGLVLLQILTGIGLYYLGLPPTYQVIHLSVAAIMISVEFFFLLIGREVQSPETTQ